MGNASFTFYVFENLFLKRKKKTRHIFNIKLLYCTWSMLQSKYTFEYCQKVTLTPLKNIFNPNIKKEIITGSFWHSPHPDRRDSKVLLFSHLDRIYLMWSSENEKCHDSVMRKFDKMCRKHFVKTQRHPPNLAALFVFLCTRTMISCICDTELFLFLSIKCTQTGSISCI